MSDDRRNLTSKQKKRIYAVSIVFGVSAMLILGYFLSSRLLEYGNDPVVFRNWIKSYGTLSYIVFVGIIMLQVVIAVIPGEPFEVAAGFCFGVFKGTILTLVGITLGSALIYILVKKISKDISEVFFSQKEISSISFLRDSLKVRSAYFLLNVLPGTPKDLLTYCVGLTGIDFKTWILMVFFGRIPSVLTSVLIGSGIAEKSHRFTMMMTLITILLSVFGIHIYRKIIEKNNREENKNGE